MRSRPDGVDKVLIRYTRVVGIDGFGPHALLATAATEALKHDTDIAKVRSG